LSAQREHQRQVLTGTKRRADEIVRDKTGGGRSLLSLARSPEGRLLRGHLRPKLRTIGVIGVLGTLSTAFEALRLVLLLVALKLIVGGTGETGTSSGVLGFSIDLGFLDDLEGTSGVIIALSGLGLATVLKEAADISVNWLSVRVQGHLMYEIRRDLLDKLLTLEASYFTDTKPGDLTYLQNTIVNRFSALVPTVRVYLQAAVDLLVAVALLFLLSIPLTLVLLVLALVLFLSTRLVESRTRRLSFESEDASREAATHFLETVRGIRLVKLGGQQDRIRRRYLDHAHRLVHTLGRHLVFQAVTASISRTGGVLVVVALAIGMSAFGGVDPGVDAGLALGFLTISLRAVVNVTMLNDARLKLSSMVPHFLMIADFILDDRYIEESSRRAMPEMPAIRDSIATERVTFEYEEGRSVLDDVSLEFPRGTVTAIVGASGSGKTTLVELLAGYRPVQRGRVLADGHDVSAYDASSYRQQIGYVTQDTVMFHDTLRRNLTFLKPDASDEEVERALHLAAADEFVGRRGLDAMVGEQGLKVSGGQRQRIALARVLLQDPPVLLLDEATNGLDLYTEAQVFSRLLELRKDKIAIVVAHRLSAITRFDRIVVMHQGRVVEEGTHHELLDRRGLYFHLYGLQEYSPEASLAALSTL
jgi:ABC-type multidrug transport system fused ATPase/permease subunit